MPEDDAAGDNLADILTLRQAIFTSCEDILQTCKTAPQSLGDACADVQDAQTKEHSPQVALAAVRHAVEKVPG